MHSGYIKEEIIMFSAISLGIKPSKGGIPPKDKNKIKIRTAVVEEKKTEEKDIEEDVLL